MPFNVRPENTGGQVMQIDRRPISRPEDPALTCVDMSLFLGPTPQREGDFDRCGESAASESV